MRETSIERLAKAIGYPERIPGGVASFVLRVDGAEVSAEEADGRTALSCALSGDDSHLRALASFAAGRMLKEDAALSYGGGRAFLWQDAPADSDAHGLLRLFETFMDSCDWWRARVDALAQSVDEPSPEAMVIRP